MKLTKLLFVLAFGLFVASCADKDETAPVINITSPEDGATVVAGEVFNLRATVTDNEELASIVISDGNTTTPVSTFDSATSHDVNFNVTIDAASEEGDLVMSITATDAEGNESTVSRTIKVEAAATGCQPAAECSVAGLTTLLVITPEGTPADAQIEVVGAFNGWPGELDENFVLTKNGDNCYCIAVEFDEGVEFKFRRDGSWDKVEKDAAGEEIDNRIFTANPDGVIAITIEKWADL